MHIARGVVAELSQHCDVLQTFLQALVEQQTTDAVGGSGGKNEQPADATVNTDSTTNPNHRKITDSTKRSSTHTRSADLDVLVQRFATILSDIVVTCLVQSCNETPALTQQRQFLTATRPFSELSEHRHPRVVQDVLRVRNRLREILWTATLHVQSTGLPDHLLWRVLHVLKVATGYVLDFFAGFPLSVCACASCTMHMHVM